MKKHNLLLAALMVNVMAFAQVGINTENPQGIFNIDGGKDNPTTGTAHTAAQQLNDFTVLASGNVGIGTTVPTQKLEIKTGGTSATPVTGFKLTDGTQANQFVLTSDANGVGTWQAAGKITYKMGTHIQNNGVNIPFTPQTGDYWVSTGAYIKLPAGTWRIEITELLGGYTDNATHLTADDWMWFRFSLTSRTDAATPSTTPLSGTLSTILTPDFIRLNPTTGAEETGNPQYVSTNYDGPRIASPTRYAVANGNFLIKNTVETTYYLIANPYNGTSNKPGFYYRNVGARNWGENRIIASSVALTN